MTSNLYKFQVSNLHWSWWGYVEGYALALLVEGYVWQILIETSGSLGLAIHYVSWDFFPIIGKLINGGKGILLYQLSKGLCLLKSIQMRTYEFCEGAAQQTSIIWIVLHWFYPYKI